MKTKLKKVISKHLYYNFFKLFSNLQTDQMTLMPIDVGVKLKQLLINQNKSSKIIGILEVKEFMKAFVNNEAAIQMLLNLNVHSFVLNSLISLTYPIIMYVAMNISLNYVLFNNYFDISFIGMHLSVLNIYVLIRYILSMIKLCLQLTLF